MPPLPCILKDASSSVLDELEDKKTSLWQQSENFQKTNVDSMIKVALTKINTQPLIHNESTKTSIGAD